MPFKGPPTLNPKRRSVAFGSMAGLSTSYSASNLGTLTRIPSVEQHHHSSNASSESGCASMTFGDDSPHQFNPRLSCGDLSSRISSLEQYSANNSLEQYHGDDDDDNDEAEMVTSVESYNNRNNSSNGNGNANNSVTIKIPSNEYDLSTPGSESSYHTSGMTRAESHNGTLTSPIDKHKELLQSRVNNCTEQGTLRSNQNVQRPPSSQYTNGIREQNAR